MTIPRTLPEQMSDLYRRLGEIERRNRNRRRTGTVSDVRGDGYYRVLLSEQGGKEFKTGWIRPRQLGAGTVKIDVVLAEGEQVDVVSENGDLTDAMIEMSAYSNDNPREGDGTPLHIKIGGNGIIICGTLRIEADVEIDGKVTITGAGVTHNGANIGSTHIHGGVTPGGADTDVPSN